MLKVEKSRISYQFIYCSNLIRIKGLEERPFLRVSFLPKSFCEWSERNLPLTLDRITYGSNKRVWWKANCGHEW